MATQPIHNHNRGEPNDAPWRILAKEALLEKDPEKLMEIVSALTQALDEQTPKGK